jgi:hypothetical protein
MFRFKLMGLSAMEVVVGVTFTKPRSLRLVLELEEVTRLGWAY